MGVDATEFTSLLVRARGGDEAALVQLGACYADAVKRAARAMLSHHMRPHFDPLDLVQSVHALVLAGLREHKFTFSSREQLIALALTLVRRTIARHWRHLKRQPGFGPGAIPLPPEDELPCSPAPGGSDPARSVMLKEEVDGLLARLERRDRQLVRLRLEGWYTVDISREVGIDPHALRARFSRVRQRLRRCGSGSGTP
jgi:RNA polymerase sigma factor (sigma-70 family)